MNIKKTFLIAGTILALIVIILAVVWVFRPAPSSVGKARPRYTLSASNLLNEFETDENSANTKYLDKVLEVSGTVSNIADDETAIIVTLKEPGGSAGVICSFDKNNIEPDNFERGNKIVVKGVCTGYLLDVVLTRCILIE